MYVVSTDTIIETIERLVRASHPNHEMLGELVLEAEKRGVSDEVIINLLCQTKRYVVSTDTIIETIERLLREGNPNHKMLGELVLEAEKRGVSDEVIINLLCQVRKQK